MKKIIIMMIMVMALVGCGSKGISYDDFMSVSNGDSRSRVESILGDGEYVSGSGGITMYSYDAGLGKSVMITYNNGRVYSKAQFGLK